MKYSYSFGKKSSKIILGTTYFGSLIPLEDAFSLLDRFCELGGCHIDTARMYSDGEAEKVIGKWMKDRKPEGIFVSTKGGFPTEENPEASRLTEKEIRFDLETSLKALETDCIDFYWLHRDDESIPVGEVIEIMNKLVKEGKIICFGASNWKAYRISGANDYAKAQGLLGFSASQIRFSPAIFVPGGNSDNTLVEMTKQEFQFYKSAKIPVAGYAAQAKGFFSKMAQYGDEGLSDKAKRRYLCDENLSRLDYIKQLSAKYECSVAAVVCGALCSIECPDVFPIIGGRTVCQIEDSISGADLDIEKSELRELFKLNIN